MLGIALDLPDSRIYWTNENGPLSYANLDGSGGANVNLTGASTGPGFYKGAAIDPVSRRIFWTKYKNASPYEPVVSSAALDESGGSDLATPGAPEEFTEGVAIDPTARRIYWANPGFFLSAGIYYAALDGSGAHKLNISGIPVAGANFPTLLKAPLGTGAPKLTAQIALRPRFLTCDEGTWAGNLPQSQVYRAPRSFSYQWLKDGQPVAGATKSNIGVEGSPGGDYACQVTATNAGGSTVQTSAAAVRLLPDRPEGDRGPRRPRQGRNGAAEADLPGGRRPLRRPAPPRIEAAAAQGAIVGRHLRRKVVLGPRRDDQDGQGQAQQTREITPARMQKATASRRRWAAAASRAEPSSSSSRRSRSAANRTAAARGRGARA